MKLKEIQVKRMRKSEKESISNNKKRIFSSKINTNRLYAYIIVCIVIGSVIAIFSVTFFSATEDGFSELMLLTYDPVEEEYEAEVYPFFIYRLYNISIYCVVKNFENLAVYYQLQVKATKLSQNISTVTPLSTNFCYIMYPNKTFEKILSPASNAEKKESGTLIGGYIWGPTAVELYLNGFIDIVIEWDTEVKIVFELWKFNTMTESFEYTGVFTFLELIIRWS